MGKQNLKIIGTQSPTYLAALCCESSLQQAPHPNLFIFSTPDEEEQFIQSVQFFDPTLKVISLPSFDVSPYSGLYPGRMQVGKRLHWLNQALNARNGQVFSTSIEALLQKTLPQEVFVDDQVSIRKNQTLPSNLEESLIKMGYSPTAIVENFGQFAIRGGIIDIFSPALSTPVRFELFGDEVESIRTFDPENQRSLTQITSAEVITAREALYVEDELAEFVDRLQENWRDRDVSDRDKQEILHQINRRSYFHGMEFLLPSLYKELSSPLDYFMEAPKIFFLENFELKRVSDEKFASLKLESHESQSLAICPDPELFYGRYEELKFPKASQKIYVDKVDIEDFDDNNLEIEMLEFRTSDLKEFTSQIKALADSVQQKSDFVADRLRQWRSNENLVFLTTATMSQAQRLESFLERKDFIGKIVDDSDYLWNQWADEQRSDSTLVHIIPRLLPVHIRLQDEKIIFLKDEDILGEKIYRKPSTGGQSKDFFKEVNFSDLKEGDYIVHKLHGVGVYGGLKVMPIQGVDAEFLQIDYKDKDRLYLPIYRIGQVQRFQGPKNPSALDKLGGQQWQKTKTKVRSHLRDVAADLLKIYSERSLAQRPPYSPPDADFQSFESAFPYDETPDQEKAIQSILDDLSGEKPMDRLVCGDVGFGKTEVAMRAAFKVVQDQKQVAVIAPTTVLTFQHFETFKKRFKDWPLEIRSLNRFVPKKEVTKTLKDLKEGKVDIVIGTHRLLSKDIHFQNLGLMIVDEEQKFGVKHKERLRKFKVDVDTLSLSATPIPRTLNMSLVGLRDLSLINTPPRDRLPTRTFVTKFDIETIKRSVSNEITRGGQVFFIHNRIDSIYALADELRQALPDVRMKVAHGQMEETQLEQIMVSFFNHELDILLCTTIVESGVDVPRANTMFIDNAHTFGLSQLYQLRGRVGRSKERAYCYLLVPPHKKIDPDAKERLKVLQENTALGSGITIAQHDLELRGAGDMLGEQQSGQINAVGYELYLELLEEAIAEAKGDPIATEELEPEINLRIPALIPDVYIPDIRIRLNIYKKMSDANSESEIEDVEADLRDQFGKPPEVVLNLLGVMMVRLLCKRLSVRDLSCGPKTLSLTVTDKTPLPVNKMMELASRPNKKYAITPDQRLNVRMNDITWPKVYDELNYLLGIC